MSRVVSVYLAHIGEDAFVSQSSVESTVAVGGASDLGFVGHDDFAAEGEAWESALKQVE